MKTIQKTTTKTEIGCQDGLSLISLKNPLNMIKSHGNLTLHITHTIHVTFITPVIIPRFIKKNLPVE